VRGGWKEADAGTSPRLVNTVPRLRDELDGLIQLAEAEAPPLRRVRASRKMQILY
jgi:hypothetical protein